MTGLVILFIPRADFCRNGATLSEALTTVANNHELDFTTGIVLKLVAEITIGWPDHFIAVTCTI
jgi:hypothetical protein